MKAKGIAQLTDIDLTDASIYGTKAVNLARAISLGFSVPNGFAVSRLVGVVEFADIAQDVLDKLPMPLAVRSSAIKEDSANKSFAGIFETELGVSTKKDLLKAFAKVKNSGLCDYVKSYEGMACPPEQVAVLVQSMVDAEVAGVAFSRDPITGEDKVIIESNYGLGKSVVDGIVTPDSIEVLYDGTIKTFIGRKRKKIKLCKKGICEQTVDVGDAERCSLADVQIAKIEKLAREVEVKFGFPADIEWVIDAMGELWLLQVRPITTI